MKAKTIAPEACIPGLSGLPCTTEQGRGGGEREVEKPRRGILTYMYRLVRMNASGQAESENAVPASARECCPLRVILRRSFDGYAAI
jgi:hypothetical protein